MPLKFQDPKWRFKSPGPLTPRVINSFIELITAIAEQGTAKDVYETFKYKFSSGQSGPSSTAGFARTDMEATMSEAALNAPRFIAAFLGGCESLGKAGNDVPDIDLVNEQLAEHAAGYQIIGDTLVATSESVNDVNVVVASPAHAIGIPSSAIVSGNAVVAAQVVHPSVAAPPLNVFLCHSSGDKEAVRALYMNLKADGFKPWLDEEDLVGGQDWDLEIKKAVRDSHVVAVCLSESSVSKTGYVQKEISVALDAADLRPEGAIFIVPLRLEDCPVPERLSRIHYIDLFKADGYKKLAKALNTRRESVR